MIYTIKLENSLEEWKPLIKIGNYGIHPKYGPVIFTPVMLDDFVKNFDDNVMGRDIAFNYNHNGKNMAALWIKKLRKVIENGKTVALEYLPEYTPTGKALIDGKEYKYVSLEYSEKLQGYGAVLTGGACTNDPFLTGEGLTLLENENKKENERSKIMDEITKKLEAVTAENARLKADIELQKKLSADNEEVKKLQAEIVKRDNQLLENQMSILKYQLEAEKAKWKSEGVPGGLIETAEKRLLESQNRVIKLENSTEQEISLLSYTNELFGKLPESARVPMKSVTTEKIKELEAGNPATGYEAGKNAALRFNKSLERGN